MARPTWSGQIQISLVSFGVSFFVATESKGQMRFHQISRSTGERVRHQKVVESAVDQADVEPSDVVTKDEIVKGYEYSKGKYVTIEPSELDALRLPSKHVIAVEQFITRQELDPEYVDKPYFVVPENNAQAEAFAVVRQALEKADKMAIGKVTFAGRENIVAIGPAEGRGMMAYTLRFAGELRDQREYFRDIAEVTVNKDELELAESLIKKRSGKFDPSKFVDKYEVAVKELVEAKLHNLPVPKDEAPAKPSGKVVNLLDALRKSLDDDRGKTAKKPAHSEKAPRKGIQLVKPPKATPRRKTA